MGNVPVGWDESRVLETDDEVATQTRPCIEWGDKRLHPETDGPCWTFAIGELLHVWAKMVPTLPCLPCLSRLPSRPCPWKVKLGLQRFVGGALGWSSWACG